VRARQLTPQATQPREGQLRPRSLYPQGRGGTNTATTVIAAGVAALALAAGASAKGGSGGTGGTGANDGPKVSDVHCIQQCAGVRKAAEGSKVELAGRHLGSTESVRFNGPEGRIVVTPDNVARRSVKAEVPPLAQTGHPSIDGPYGTEKSPTALTIVPVDQIPAGGDFELRSAEANPTKAFYDGEHRARVRYQFCCETTDIRIEVIKKKSGEVISSWREPNQEPNTERASTWNGRTDAGRPAGKGRYKFKVGPPSGGAKGTDATDFGYFAYKFPVRGKHGYGDGIGAGRGHQGQDVFANCGTPLEAARGGRVQTRQYHSAAGYYLVIDGKRTGRDFVYMHMLRRGRAHDGERVHTGERIGYVGETGNAVGCHLHFEIWSAPGWYEGGHFTNPTDDLKAWDRYS
jgi:murein DD-endopeptidase MepM/ murein hydrolase activator NlpD